MSSNTIDFDGICKLVFDTEYKFTDFINATFISGNVDIKTLKLLNDCLVKASSKTKKEIKLYEKKN